MRSGLAHHGDGVVGGERQDRVVGPEPIIRGEQEVVESGEDQQAGCRKAPFSGHVEGARDQVTNVHRPEQLGLRHGRGGHPFQVAFEVAPHSHQPHALRRAGGNDRRQMRHRELASGDREGRVGQRAEAVPHPDEVTELAGGGLVAQGRDHRFSGARAGEQDGEGRHAASCQ